MSEGNRSRAANLGAEGNGAEPDLRSAIVGDDLAVGYPSTEDPVVDLDRLDVPEGAVTAVVGPNGSGKSTLLNALAGHLDPDSGAVMLHGRELDAISKTDLARELGHLSQEHTSPNGITVEDLVTHGRYPHRGFFETLSEDDRAAVERALERAGVADLRDREVGQLSGGQKQLVWIAMVLAQETETLLLDEPTTFLDLHHQLRVLETIRRLNEEDGVTVAVVLHDVGQAARFADYLIAMRDGDVYDWGPPRDVVTEDLLGEVFQVDAAIRHSPEFEIVPKRALDGRRRG